MKSSITVQGCFITGSDTDAGKTTIVAGLARALCNRGYVTKAIKPVQTGCAHISGNMTAPDVELYKEALNGFQGDAFALYCFKQACSPHLAARLAGHEFNAAALALEIRAHLSPEVFSIIEGAGGAFAPLNESQTMLDLMRELGLPVIIAIPNKLGCINHALMTMNLLSQSGLPLAGLLLCKISSDDSAMHRDNAIFLRERGREMNIPLLCELPYMTGLHSKTAQERSSAWQTLSGYMDPVVEAILALPSSTEDYSAEDKKLIWHPYAGTNPPPRVYTALSASGTRIRLSDGRELADGMSSWWCANLGYGRKDLQDALNKQANWLPHIMFGGFTHEPAITLANRLVAIAPPGLDRVFYADSGSVAVEVALKMAIQYQLALGRNNRTRICAMRGAYHGDTLGAMSVCDPVNGMHHVFSHYMPRQIFLPRPGTPFSGMEIDSESLTEMEGIIRSNSAEIAAVIVEPIVQGAGGMWFYHPAYLERLRSICSELDILLIADEIATGFGRTGKLFACEWSGISPDIMCLGKAITGGIMTFSAVLANERIAEAISRPVDSTQPGILLHGPTFMANPLACAVAAKAIDSLLAHDWQGNVKRIEKRLKHGLIPCSSFHGIKDVRVLGAIGVVETVTPVNTEKLQKFFVDQGVWLRPFNRLIYVMPPFTTTDEDIDKLACAICNACARNLHL